MSSHALATRTPWPTNLGAYLKVVSASPALAGVSLVGALGDYVGPEVALTALVALLGHLAVLLTRHTWLKITFSWLSTIAGAVLLAATSYEGADGFTWAGVAQWDSADLRVLGMLVLGSLAHTLVRNLPARYAGVAEDLLEHLDLPAPPTNDEGPEPAYATQSTVLRALSPAEVAEHASRDDVVVPAPAASPEAGPVLHAALDDALARREVTL